MKTAVITTAGLGTRLLTATKASPKTLLPLYYRSFDRNKEPLLRPLIEIIFENLYDNGFRKFCFIVGTKNKKSILNHMVPDKEYIKLLKKRNNQFDKRFVNALQKLYRKFEKCEIKWISQNSPMGFGHALLASKKFVGTKPFLLHTGDAYFPDYSFLNDFIKSSQYDKKATTTLLLQYKKSLKGFGIAQTKKMVPLDVVFHVAEKPKKPQSNLAILPIYILKPDIFEALEKTGLGHNNELQVTDAISTLMAWNHKVTAYNFRNNKWFDIGTTREYFHALNHSFKIATK
jgi:UTP--glucose-1-phosphate uridylyltransferase